MGKLLLLTVNKFSTKYVILGDDGVPSGGKRGKEKRIYIPPVVKTVRNGDLLNASNLTDSRLLLQDCELKYPWYLANCKIWMTRPDNQRFQSSLSLFFSLLPLPLSLSLSLVSFFLRFLTQIFIYLYIIFGFAKIVEQSCGIGSRLILNFSTFLIDNIFIYNEECKYIYIP